MHFDAIVYMVPKSVAIGVTELYAHLHSPPPMNCKQVAKCVKPNIDMQKISRSIKFGVTRRAVAVAMSQRKQTRTGASSRFAPVALIAISILIRIAMQI